MPDASESIETLKTSRDSRKLAQAAQTLAASSRAEDHQALLGFLRTPEFRLRLDSPQGVKTGPEDLWIAKPLRTLQSNHAPSARAVLVELMADRDFTEDLDRVDLLVEASAQMRPPAAGVVQFWRRFGATNSVHLNGIMRALMENGEPAAVAEFERIMLSTQPDPDTGDPRLDWLRSPMLCHRDNPHVLAMCERLVQPHPSPWSRAMQVAVAESLFLHQSDWYRRQPAPLPPSRAKTPKQGRDTLRRIADYVMANLSPSPVLKAGIMATRGELDLLDRMR
jgi:hypothetical protein